MSLRTLSFRTLSFKTLSFRTSRSPAAAASVLAAGLVFTVASCGHVIPLRPASPAAPAVVRPLAAALVLQPVLPVTSTGLADPQSGDCLAGSVKLSFASAGIPGYDSCYRLSGTPLTITSAGISTITSPGITATSGTNGPGIWVTLPAADDAAMSALTAQAAKAGEALAVTIDGKVWAAPLVEKSFGGHFEIPMETNSQALQVQRLLTR